MHKDGRLNPYTSFTLFLNTNVTVKRFLQRHKCTKMGRAWTEVGKLEGKWTSGKGLDISKETESYTGCEEREDQSQTYHIIP